MYIHYWPQCIDRRWIISIVELICSSLALICRVYVCTLPIQYIEEFTSTQHGKGPNLHNVKVFVIGQRYPLTDKRISTLAATSQYSHGCCIRGAPFIRNITFTRNHSTKSNGWGTRFLTAPHQVINYRLPFSAFSTEKYNSLHTWAAEWTGTTFVVATMQVCTSQTKRQAEMLTDILYILGQSWKHITNIFNKTTHRC